MEIRSCIGIYVTESEDLSGITNLDEVRFKELEVEDARSFCDAAEPFSIQ